MNLASTSAPAVSSNQLLANRANAQQSTGPRSEAGKSKSSLNAVKTGLTGRTILLPSEDAIVYSNHVARFARDFEPIGDRECELVQSLADTQWRLNRIPSLEAGIYAYGRVLFADLFQEEDAAIRAHLIENHTFTVHSRQLSNLYIQETRLRRHYASDAAELAALQQRRREVAKPVPVRPATLPQAPSSQLPIQPNGFVFANASSELTSAPQGPQGTASSDPESSGTAAAA